MKHQLAISVNAHWRLLAFWMIPLALLVVAGCSSNPRNTASSPAPQLTDERSEIVLAALGHLDIPYVYGGNDANGLDCSALVQRVYRLVGLHVPRTSAQQAQSAQRISRSQIKPGDGVFFATRRGPINHVGIYIGDGRFVHAPSTGSQVRIEPLDTSYWQPRLQFAGRFL